MEQAIWYIIEIMRTKQEVSDFLESKVGGGVECKGNPSLNSQCVTLIKALMEFLGVPEPYKARGNANTCISTYLGEGIADEGTGFISVFSNKKMAKGVGHVWLNVGEGKGTYYESNGVKPLTVTKGKTYSYDNVCNFDKYLKGDDMSDCREARDRHWNNLVKLAGGVDVVGLSDDNENDKTEEALARIRERQATNSDMEAQLKAKETELGQLRASLEGEKSAMIALKQEMQTFTETLAGKLTTIVDKSAIIGAVEKLLSVEDQLTQAKKELSQAERAKQELEAEKDRQIQGLKDEINELRKKNDDLEAQVDRQAEQIERLGKRLDELGNHPVTEVKPILTSLTDFIKRMFKKG